MLTHVKVLSVIFIAFNALGVLGAVLVLFVFGVAAGGAGISGDPDALQAAPLISLLGTGFFIFLLAVSLPGLITGIGLLKLQPWARIVGIILCAINLIYIPIGTIIGAYGLWVLLNGETERLFKAATPARA